MRGVAVSVVAAWLTLCSATGAAAAVDAREAFEAGKAAFADQDYLLALSHFQAAREHGLDGPAIHYNLGVCHYRLGEYQSANAAFRHIADTYPPMRGLAQYNLGLIALRRGQRAEAESLFRQALANSEDETVRRLARRQLPIEAEPQPARGRWFSLIDARLGHDDNVLLLAEEITLPDGESAESSFTQLFALLGGPLTSEPGFRFDGSLYAVRYPDASIFDQTALRLRAQYRWGFGAWGAEAGPHYSYSTLDGDAFESRAGIGLRLRRSLTTRSALSIRYVHDEVTAGEDRFAFVEGSREWLELRVDRRSARGRLTLAYALESNDRADPNVSPTRNKLSFRYRYPFGGRWLADLAFSMRESRYDDLTDEREEELSELSLGLTRSLLQGWELAAVLSVADNDSDVEAARYDRQRVSLGISKPF